MDSDFYNDVLDLIDESGDLAAENQTAWDDTSYGPQLEGPLNGSSLNSQDVNGDLLYSLSDLGIQEYVEVRFYVDGVLKFTKQVTDSNMFKLPRGFKDKKWEIELLGMIPVKRVTMATSTEEIV